MAPDWLRAAAPEAWYKRYAHRVEDGRLPQAAAEREAYARAVGEDGFALLDRLDRPEAPEGLGRLPKVEVLRRVWARHFVRGPAEPPAGGGSVRLRGKDDPPPSAEPVESPYDPEARFRTRSGTSWTGYVVHLSETCEDDMVNLLTHAMTTVATVHEARCTAAIHQALAGKGLTPGEHLVDAAYVDAELLVRGREELGIDLRRPAAAEPVLAGQGRRRLHDRPLRGRLGRAAGALPPGQAVLGLEPPGRPGRHALRLGHVPPGRLRRLPGAAPLHAGQASGSAPEAAAAGRARGAQGEPRDGSAPRRGGAATPGGPGSRAPSRKGCAPSGCAAAATAGWPRPTCSTWRPRPRSTSTASPPGSGRCRAPPPAPRASPPSPLEPTSPTVSGRFRGSRKGPVSVMLLAGLVRLSWSRNC